MFCGAATPLVLKKVKISLTKQVMALHALKNAALFGTVICTKSEGKEWAEKTTFLFLQLGEC